MDARSERIARRFEWPVLIAALLVIPVIAIEESNVEQPWDSIAYWTNWAIWIVFAAEVVTLLMVVPNKWEWVKRHPIEVAIVVLTPPFLPASLQAARALRLLRLLRLVMLAQLVREMFTPTGVRYAAFLMVITVLGGGAAFSALEDEPSGLDGMYWAITTMTTVGYGDFSPETSGGRIVAVVVMLVGIGFVALLTGAIAQRFLAPTVEEIGEETHRLEMEEDELLREVREISDRLRRVEQALGRRGG